MSDIYFKRSDNVNIQSALLLWYPTLVDSQGACLPDLDVISCRCGLAGIDMITFVNMRLWGVMHPTIIEDRGVHFRLMLSAGVGNAE